MTKTTRTNIYFLLPAAFISLLLSIYSIAQNRQYAAEENRARLLQSAIQKADSLKDNREAVAAYKKLQPMFPEVQLRILQRQWLIALELLGRAQRARYNNILQNDAAAYGTALKNHLDDMLDRCAGILTEKEPPRGDILWRVYNVAGAAKLLTAFLMLESDKNIEKVQGVMRDALTDFKSAIEAVDKSNAAPFQRNIPRWNFELLNGEQFIKKLEAVKTDIEKNAALKENLETLLPEMGGYAPGEPVETRIKK